MKERGHDTHEVWTIRSGLCGCGRGAVRVRGSGGGATIGAFEGQGIEVCGGGTVGVSAPGDFVAVFRFRGAGDDYSGHLTVISASGGLSGLHAGGSFAGTTSASRTA
jgi:hypothetical protein